MQIADDVFCFTATDVNFVVVREGTDLTLIDGGYPGDAGTVIAAVRSIGHRPEDVRAILLTHAHVDHLGAALHLHRWYGTPLLTGPAEVSHARREYLEQLRPARLAANVWRPGLIGWAARIVAAGALHDEPAAQARAFAGGEQWDLPGHPVAVPTPGHTSGHSAYLLPGCGVVATGDALVTGHALLRAPGPQLLPRFFNHDQGRTRATLDILRTVDADCIAPGHGEVYRGALSTAVDEAAVRADA